MTVMAEVTATATATATAEGGGWRVWARCSRVRCSRTSFDGVVRGWRSRARASRSLKRNARVNGRRTRCWRGIRWQSVNQRWDIPHKVNVQVPLAERRMIQVMGEMWRHWIVGQKPAYSHHLKMFRWNKTWGPWQPEIRRRPGLKVIEDS
ncbi:hypothetical protein BKA81DRAFT_372352 [Phyllosticta paracitricarpa]